MRKKGQFYLIAAFAIVVIISGLAYVYTSVKVTKQNINLEDFADEADYEVVQLINNQVLDGKPPAEISNRIKEILDYYENKYLGTEIKVVYGDEDNAFEIDSKNIKPVTPMDGKVKVSLNSLEKEIDMKEKNHYVLVYRESDGEVSFAVR